MSLSFLSRRSPTPKIPEPEAPQHDAARREAAASQKVTNTLAALIVLVAVAAGIAQFQTQKLIAEITAAEQVGRMLDEANTRLDAAQIRWRRIEEGDSPRLRRPPLAREPLVTEHASLHPLALAVDSSLASAWRCLLWEADAAGMRSIGDTAAAARMTARAVQESEIADGFAARGRRLARDLERRYTFPVRALSESSTVFVVLLLCSAILSFVALRRAQQNRREMGRHLRGALLTEEMLELYGRGLEQKNEELQRAHDQLLTQLESPEEADDRAA